MNFDCLHQHRVRITVTVGIALTVLLSLCESTQAAVIASTLTNLVWIWE